jgi:N6-adenosine-specific RNA methylase IME4
MIHLPFPSEQYACIVADPPWQYRDRGYNGMDTVQKYRIHTPYQTMSVQELIDMSLEVRRVSASSCHCYMWATKDFRVDAQKIMESWGFTFKNEIPWVKTTQGLKRNQKGLEQFTAAELKTAEKVMAAMGMPGKPSYGMGYYMRPQHEILLFGTNNRSFRPLNATCEPAMVFAAKTRHSAKPEAAFDLIRRNTPGPRLNLFERTPREGFDCWGDEMEGTA